MTIEYQKQIADEILLKLFLVDPYSIVAGGAPRSWHHGEEARDLDIFVYDTCTQTMFLQKLASLGFIITSTGTREELPEMYKKNPFLEAVYDCVYNNVKVQFMYMNKPTFDSVIAQFPLSICKAWYKDGNIVLEKDFLRGEKYKAIVRTNELYGDESLYIQKIMGYYPDYTYYEAWDDLAKALMDDF
jgi:hypothetical protein